MVPAKVKDQYVIRFAVCSEYALDEDVTSAWNIILEYADAVIEKHDSNKENEEELENHTDIYQSETSLVDIGEDDDISDDVFLYDSQQQVEHGLSSSHDHVDHIHKSHTIKADKERLRWMRKNMMFKMISGK